MSRRPEAIKRTIQKNKRLFLPIAAEDDLKAEQRVAYRDRWTLGKFYAACGTGVCRLVFARGGLLPIAAINIYCLRF